MKKVPNPWYGSDRYVPVADFLLLTGKTVGDTMDIYHDVYRCMNVVIDVEDWVGIVFRATHRTGTYLPEYTVNFYLEGDSDEEDT